MEAGMMLLTSLLLPSVGLVFQAEVNSVRSSPLLIKKVKKTPFLSLNTQATENKSPGQEQEQQPSCTSP